MDLSAALSAHTAALGALYGAYSTSAPSLCATAASALAEQITQLLTTQLAQAQTLLDHASQELQGKTTKLREWEHALERPSTVLGNGTLLDQLAHTDALLASLEADITSRTASLRALDLELSQLHAKLALPPPTPSTDLSLSSLASLKAQLATAKATLQDRTLLIIQHQSEIAQLSNELGAPLLPSSPSPTEASLAALVLERQSLETLKSSRNIKIQETYDALHPLWTVLSVPESEMESFVELHMGSTLAVLNAYTSELSRMLELKRSNLASFILRERETIKQLWDRMYYSEKMRGLSFPPFEVQVEPTFVYNAATGVPDAIPSPFISEELLAQHEAHRTTLLVELERAGEVLVKVEKYFSVVQEKEELEAASHDPSRLKSTRGDPGRLLREEKARKRVGKEGPKLEQELLHLVPLWETSNARPFLVQGRRFLELLSEKMERDNAGRSRNRTVPLRPAHTGGATTSVLRAQNTGTSTKSAGTTGSMGPLKRHLTGGASIGAKKLVPSHTGGRSKVLGEIVNRAEEPREETTGGGGGKGMRIPLGWGDDSSSASGSMGGIEQPRRLVPQSTGGFKPK